MAKRNAALDFGRRSEPPNHLALQRARVDSTEGARMLRTLAAFFCGIKTWRTMRPPQRATVVWALSAVETCSTSRTTGPELFRSTMPLSLVHVLAGRVVLRHPS
jgi:hypothetical protein